MSHSTMTRRGGSPDETGPEQRGSRRPNPIDCHVGTRVRVRRMVLGMSQERLADALGLTFQQVQKYEKGINRIGASRLYDMSRVLSVPVQFFYEELPNGAEGFADGGGPAYMAEFLGTREGLDLNKAFARITDPNVRKRVVDLVRSLAGDEEAG